MSLWDDALATAGTDFEAYTPALQAVGVAQIDPDTGTSLTAAGAALGSAAGVPALKRARRRRPGEAGDGELGVDECRFVFAAGRVTWVPKARDQITDAAGVVWLVENVEALAFGRLYALDVVVKR